MENKINMISRLGYVIHLITLYGEYDRNAFIPVPFTSIVNWVYTFYITLVHSIR